jgi:hypothetical protein
MHVRFHTESYVNPCAIFKGFFQPQIPTPDFGALLGPESSVALLELLVSFQGAYGGLTRAARLLQVDQWWYVFTTAMWYAMLRITFPLPTHGELLNWVSFTAKMMCPRDDMHLPDPFPSWEGFLHNIGMHWSRVEVRPSRFPPVIGNAVTCETSSTHTEFDLDDAWRRMNTCANSDRCTVENLVGLSMTIPHSYQRTLPLHTVVELVRETNLVNLRNFEQLLYEVWTSDSDLMDFSYQSLACEGAFRVQLDNGLASFVLFERLLNRLICRRIPCLTTINFRSHLLIDGVHFMQYQFQQPYPGGSVELEPIAELRFDPHL